jgi:uncharacterized protein (TIGR03085 family)
MIEPIDVQERREICDLLLELGPDAATLCAGWTTADLAAHLVLREHFHRWSDAQRAAEKAKGLPAMVARLRAGAPLIPWRLPRIRNIFNGLEYFIHHEDVRRANGREPRPSRADLEALAWRMTGSAPDGSSAGYVRTASSSCVPMGSGGCSAPALARRSGAPPPSSSSI